MRIAFYAPLKSPAHPTPSGDRRVARLYRQALAQAGFDVTLASELRSFDGAGDEQHQHQCRDQGQAEARALIQRWQAEAPGGRPELWFTYHAYYKSPDWIGPLVAQALGMPYVLAEASCAAKRADGPWAMGHAQTLVAVRAASLLISPTAHDLPGLRSAAGPDARIEHLPPFLDAAPGPEAMTARAGARAALAERWALDPGQPWLAVVAMMRAGDKLASYQVLARALATLQDLPWQLLVAGDGVARPEVQAALDAAAPGRVRYLGHCDPAALAEVHAASDLCVWPAVNEAYGMAMLEAQAAGLPVVSCATRGVGDVVADGVTGLLAPEGDMAGLAGHVRALLGDPARRARLGAAARSRVQERHSLTGAALCLRGWLLPLVLPETAA